MRLDQATQTQGNVTLLALLVERERRACARSYHDFFRIAWNELEPTIPFEDNWHYEILCDELQRQTERIARNESKEYDIIINVPPRTGKSSLVTIMWNAWAWIHYPHLKFITASYDSVLSLEHAVDTRRIIMSPWYQECWGEVFSFTGDQNLKSFFENDKTGYRIATSVGGSGIGRGGDVLIADDPQNVRQAESELSRKAVIDWWNKTMHSRLNKQDIGLRVVVQQRLHEDDLTGHILNHEGKKYKLFRFPAKDSDDVTPTKYRSKYVNGYLHPRLMPAKILNETRATLGTYTYSGQYEQRPSPAEGGMFKRIYWNYWKPRGSMLPPVVSMTTNGPHTHDLITLPDDFDMIVEAWDCAFRKTSGSDRVAGGKWTALGAKRFLLSIKWGQKTFLETVSAVLALRDEEPKASHVLIEGKANGDAVMNVLEDKIDNILCVDPTGSKTARATTTDASHAMSVLAQAEAGNLYLPHPALASWSDPSKGVFTEEFASFPLGKHDDMVDMTVYAVRKLSEGIARLGFAVIK